jgi:hypothetical protein
MWEKREHQFLQVVAMIEEHSKENKTSSAQNYES